MKTIRSRYATAALICVVCILGGCTGRYPARLLSKVSDKVEIVAQLEPSPSANPSAGPSAIAGSRPTTVPGSARPTQRVLAKTKSGTTVVQTASGLPKADIWPDAQDRIGITPSEIRLCMHAAFSLGPIFDTKPSDELVYWQMVKDAGGVYGRDVKMTFEDDLYTAPGTEQALNLCKQDSDPFVYMGGTGFDQAPAGRTWAETQKQPYLYNLAVEASNLKHSFSFLPSINTNGRFLGQFVGSHFADKKVGSIYVDTDNWRAGYSEFKTEISKKGMSVAPADEYKIPNNNVSEFGQFIAQAKLSGVTLVFAYINAITLYKFIIQADQQDFHPIVVSPDGFDLVTDTAGNGKQGDTIDHMGNFPGIYAGWVAPTFEVGPPNDKNNPAVPWYSEIQAMKSAYAKYLPSKTPNDVDWAFWVYMKVIHKMLLDCSKDCSRNIMAGLMLTGYKSEILGCPIDFSMGNGRVGGHYHNVWQSRSTNGKAYWRQIETCKRGFY